MKRLLSPPSRRTFPIKVVLPAKGFALKQIYVIRITATAANGASSTLNIGFKGVPARDEDGGRQAARRRNRS